MKIRTCAVAAAASGMLAATAHATTPLYGVNLSGLEASASAIPGTPGTNYPIPTLSFLDNEKIQIARVPFLLERLLTAGQPINPTYLGFITGVIQQDEAANIMTVLDPHDYGYIATDGTNREIGVDPVGTANYIDAVTKLASAVKGMSSVAFGLMNEPNAQTCGQLYPVWQQAINAIRGAGFTGPITVPPTDYDSAINFVSNGCAADFLTLTDPDNDLITELHMYQDANDSGTYTGGSDAIPSTGIGTQRLAAAVAWAKANNQRLYLGETGTPGDASSLATLNDTLTDVKDSGVFWGVTLWSAFPWWPAAYPLNINPVNGQASAQVAALERYITAPEALVLGLQEDAYNGDAQYAVQIDGKLWGSSRAETSTRLSGKIDLVSVPGPFTSGQHTVTVTFLNDAYAGSPSTDRNLFLDSVAFNGTLLGAAPQAMLGTGATASMTFVAP